jgi:DNA invertase Pin-like site-specific DNA recombinase
MMSKRETADGYIRVSRRAGREGESFISPELQRKKIEEWAKLHEVEVLAWWEEIDQSGAKFERTMFQQRSPAAREAKRAGSSSPSSIASPAPRSMPWVRSDA